MTKNTKNMDDKGVCRTLGLLFPNIKDLDMSKYLLAVGSVLGDCSKITDAGYYKNNVAVWVKEKEDFEALIENGDIDVDGNILRVYPFAEGIPRRVILKCVPPFLPNKIIMEQLSKYGTVKGAIIKETMNNMPKELRHVCSLNRTVPMSFEKDQMMPERISFKWEGEEVGFFTQVGKKKCFFCKENGHLRSACPKLKATAVSAKENIDSGEIPAAETYASVSKPLISIPKSKAMPQSTQSTANSSKISNGNDCGAPPNNKRPRLSASNATVPIVEGSGVHNWGYSAWKDMKVAKPVFSNEEVKDFLLGLNYKGKKMQGVKSSVMYFTSEERTPLHLSSHLYEIRMSLGKGNQNPQKKLDRLLRELLVITGCPVLQEFFSDKSIDTQSDADVSEME